VAARWPDAEITGIDSSLDMLARARTDHPALRWEQGDISAWHPDRTYDLVFSNAALQWVPDHAMLFPRLLGEVAEGGALAVQMPADPGTPALRLMRELAATKPWRGFFSQPIQEWHVHAPEFYYDLLAPLAARLDLWTSDYYHVLADAAAIAAWYRDTALRPFLGALPDEAARERFVTDYTALLPEAFPVRPDGKVLFPFRRLFVIAYR
jgi:trans-aconitate 2-methyltransferase